jgi:hypothetical protein
MKKIKTMLLSIAVLAIAGGALAFKVKFDAPICVMDPLIYDDPDTAPVDACVSTAGDIVEQGGIPAFITDPLDPGVVTYTLVLNGPVYCTPTDCRDLTLTTMGNPSANNK